MSDEERDRELSALLDGELSPDRARELRNEIEANPRLRERLAEFENVDERLRALPHAPLPAELGARLRERIGTDGDSHRQGSEMPTTPSTTPTTPTTTPRTPRTPTVPRTSIARWGVPLIAALAAGLVAVWMLGRVSDSDDPGAQLQATNQLNPDRPGTVEGPDPHVEAGDSSDEEIAIGLELETLRDLDLIQELDLLEALLAMETTREGPG